LPYPGLVTLTPLGVKDVEMSKHLISHASQLFYGDAYNAVAFGTNERTGVPINPLTKVSLGSPIALALDGLVAAATSTELPNAATKTYTPLTDNVSPLDGAIAAPSTVFMDGADRLVWVLDVARNITSGVAHAGTTIAMSIVIKGYDVYKQPLQETLTLTAASSTGTPVVYAGKKAFKYVSSIAITSAGNATANTLNMGWGDAIGLPYALAGKTDLVQTWFNDVLEATVPTVVVADATVPATATTGDVRGTLDLNSAMNGSSVNLWARFDPTSNDTLFGVSQYSG
jgi:hypothetical protein